MCQSSKVVTLWEVCLIFFLFIMVKTEFISTTSIVVVAYLLVVVVFVNAGLAVVLVFRQFAADTSASNLEALGERDRSISRSSFTSAGLGGGGDDGEGRRSVTAVIFSPFDVEGQLTRKEIKL